MIFADLMGWSALVRRSASDREELKRVTDVYLQVLEATQFIRAFQSGEEIGWAATFLSDSLALSCRAHDAPELLTQIALLFEALLSRQRIYVRGAIVVGDLFHRGNVIIGPALVEAVKLEKETCFPRIAIHTSAQSVIPEPMTSLDTDDGCLDFDYLKVTFRCDEHRAASLRKARKVVEANLAEHKADAALAAVVEKDEWLLRRVIAVQDDDRGDP